MPGSGFDPGIRSVGNFWYRLAKNAVCDVSHQKHPSRLRVSVVARDSSRRLQIRFVPIMKSYIIYCLNRSQPCPVLMSRTLRYSGSIRRLWFAYITLPGIHPKREGSGGRAGAWATPTSLSVLHATIKPHFVHGACQPLKSI